MNRHASATPPAELVLPARRIRGTPEQMVAELDLVIFGLLDVRQGLAAENGIPSVADAQVGRASREAVKPPRWARLKRLGWLPRHAPLTS